MSKRSSNRTDHGIRPEPIDAEVAYFHSAQIMRNRFLTAAVAGENETPLARAERIAFQVRKIVEGVAFATLSGVEVRNKQTLAELRSKDADKLLIWLDRKGLLKLPTAQRVGMPLLGFQLVLEGGAGAAAGLDLDKTNLLEMFSRASSLVHERHPERLTEEKVSSELLAVENDLHRLRGWLWLHTMYLRDSAFLIQMGQYGTSSFFVNLTRSEDIPADFEGGALK